MDLDREDELNPHTNPHEEFEKNLSKAHAGYVLITCNHPSDSGTMKVEMTYGGSSTLAGMLIEGAQTLLEEEDEEEEEEF